MSILSDFHYQFLKTLLECGVRFIILGGQAAIYYGVRRSTGDLDLLVEPSEENGKKIMTAFSTLKLQSDKIEPSEFRNNIFLGLGFEPDAIDIFTFTPGIEFHEVFDRAAILKDRDINIPIISLEDLIKNKESLQRDGEKKLLDEYDVAVLKKILGQGLKS